MEDDLEKERGDGGTYVGGKAASGYAGGPCPIGGTPNPAAPTRHVKK